MTTSQFANEVSALLAQRPSRPTWEKVCDVLDRTPADELSAALYAVDAGLASWPDDLNDGHMWPMPPRQASKRWAKSIAQGMPAPPAWSAITFLDLLDQRFDKKGAAPLFSNPAISTLTHLNLAQCDLRDAGLQQMLDSPHTGALTHLVIGGNWLGQGSAAKLLPHTLGRQLYMLDIGRNQLGAHDLDALLTTSLPLLSALYFDHSACSIEQLTPILHADTLTALRTLTLGTFNDDIDLTLARSPEGHPHIKRALWHGWLRQRSGPKLKALAAERSIPKAAKLNRPALIAALLPLDP
jgi:hypothetical protein